DAILIQHLPHGRNVARTIIILLGTEQGVMPVSQRTQRWMRFQILDQPLALHRLDPRIDVTVEDDDVPLPQVIAVETAMARPGIPAEVVKVRHCAFCRIVVVAQRWASSLLETPPGRVIALLVVIRRPIWIGVVPSRENRPWDLVDQERGGLITGHAAD